MHGTQETAGRYPYAEVISTRKVRAEDGTLYLDMKCGNLMVQRITRIQTDQVLHSTVDELLFNPPSPPPPARINAAVVVVVMVVQAHEISRLIRQYIEIQSPGSGETPPNGVTLSRNPHQHM